MKRIRTLFFAVAAGLFFISCNVNNSSRETLTASQQRQLDSILTRGIDYEALYTLLDNIKPMSTVASFSYPIANEDSTKSTSGDLIDLKEKQQYLDKISNIQDLLSTLDYPDLQFVLAPFKSAYRGYRSFDLVVIRPSMLDSLLTAKASFFGQFGLVPGTDPAIVLASVENSGRYERLRGYGYLFGYPDYAVDFFIQAAVEGDSLKKVSPRKFFQIPSYSFEKGAFVYAYPPDYTPGQVDSTLYYRAVRTLNKYTEMRSHYLNPDSTLQVVKLLDDYYKK